MVTFMTNSIFWKENQLEIQFFSIYWVIVAWGLYTFSMDINAMLNRIAVKFFPLEVKTKFTTKNPSVPNSELHTWWWMYGENFEVQIWEV